jgi:hypothetical protein
MGWITNTIKHLAWWLDHATRGAPASDPATVAK